MRIAVAGGSGFVGSRLSLDLADAGHGVIAMARRPDGLPTHANIEPRATDVGDFEDLTDALQGVEVAYYLVHSMGGGQGFEARDRALASTFARSAAKCGVGRIVYVGALGHGELSTHLASRQEVGEILGSTGVDVVELRAAVVLGQGSISFEMLRYLVERLPFMVGPRWLRTKLQPIAASDLHRYLVRSIEVPPGTYEIGGEVTTYEDMIAAYASIRGLMKRRILKVPVLSLSLSAYWVDFVTPVDRRISHSLIESLGSEVLVRDAASTREAFGFDPTPLETALARTVTDQANEIDERLFDRTPGLADGVYTMRDREKIGRDDIAKAGSDLEAIGGDLGWYGIATAWRVRLALGRLVGEVGEARRPERLAPGEQVDWWTVVSHSDRELILRATAWRAGDAWLGYRVTEEGSFGWIEVVASFRPKGIGGFVYWKTLGPLHRAAFRIMAKHRAAAARRTSAA